MNTKIDDNQKLLIRYKTILTILITSLSITGISCLDDRIWDLVMLVIGMVAYSIVGLLYSVGFLKSKSTGKSAYAFVFIILLLIGYGIYKGIVEFQIWVSNWPLWIKISVPLMFFTLIIKVLNHILEIKGNQQKDIIYNES